MISTHELSHLVQLLANCQASAHTDRAAGSDVTKLFHVQPQLSARNRLLLVNVWLRAACSHGNGILQQSWLERLQALQLKVEEAIQKEDGSDEGSDALERNDVKTNTTQTARPHVKLNSPLLRADASADAREAVVSCLASASHLLRAVTSNVIGQFERCVNSGESGARSGSRQWALCVESALHVQLLMFSHVHSLDGDTSTASQASNSVIAFTCAFLQQATNVDDDVTRIRACCDVTASFLRQMRARALAHEWNRVMTS